VEATSLALTTELALAATRGKIADRGEYLVVETPDEPGWSDGNYLVLARPPRAGELAEWTRRFQRELGRERVVVLRWDGPGDEEFDGWTVDVFEMMVADEVLAPVHELAMQELAPDELPATAELAWMIGDRHDEAYHQFLKRRAAWQAKLVAGGRARFLGAFDGGKLVASVGLFDAGTVARYQDVQTLPAYRRRGVAGALLAAAARATRVERFAILAEPGSDAQRVYRRVGFRTAERTTRAQAQLTARLTR
jgi:GNAT superfamily N-acetyltransferase